MRHPIAVSEVDPQPPHFDDPTSYVDVEVRGSSELHERHVDCQVPEKPDICADCGEKRVEEDPCIVPGYPELIGTVENLCDFRTDKFVESDEDGQCRSIFADILPGGAVVTTCYLRPVPQFKWHRGFQEQTIDSEADFSWNVHEGDTLSHLCEEILLVNGDLDV